MKPLNTACGALAGAATAYLMLRFAFSTGRPPLMDVVAGLAAILLMAALTLLCFKTAMAPPEESDEAGETGDVEAEQHPDGEFSRDGRQLGEEEASPTAERRSPEGE